MTPGGASVLINFLRALARHQRAFGPGLTPLASGYQPPLNILDRAQWSGSNLLGTQKKKHTHLMIVNEI